MSEYRKALLPVPEETNMPRNTSHQRANAAAYRKFSRPTYPSTRDIVVTARRFRPGGDIIAVLSLVGFAAWFLIMWSA